MSRIIAPVIGLFFALSVLWAFLAGAIADVPLLTQYGSFVAPSAVSRLHLEPKELKLASDGPFGHFDRQQLQRGYEVYAQVCANCHSLKYVSFRDLKALGYNDDEVKAIAAKYTVPAYNPATGVLKSHPGLPADHFPKFR